MYKLYSMQRSGNSYKVRLALALLNAPYRAIEIDILRGESRTPDFLAMNPSGQVPLLEVEPGRYLAESNAILWYVAGGTSLAPDTRIERAEALQWMFFEQHALEPNIGAAYFWLSLVKGGRTLQTHALEDWMERGYAALQRDKASGFGATRFASLVNLSNEIPNVQALFNAALRQQLQGPPCAGVS